MNYKHLKISRLIRKGDKGHNINVQFPLLLFLFQLISVN